MLKYIFVFLYGLVCGSYFNVVGMRLYQESGARPIRSYCDHCKRQLKWWELVPVLSYIGLKGHCSKCHHQVSILYPVMELTVAILWTLTVIKFGFTQTSLFYIVLWSGLAICTVSDLIYYKISNKVLLIGFVVLGLSHQLPLSESLVGISIMILIFAISLFINSSAIGMGDVKLMLLLSFYLGAQISIWILMLASLLGVFYCLLFKPIKIPFVPFIFTASIVVVFVWL